jgi:hypothetical protein
MVEGFIMMDIILLALVKGVQALFGWIGCQRMASVGWHG